MFNRRTMLALTAAAPFATRLPRLDMPDLRVDPIELPDGAEVQMLGISPDASTLVGLQNRDQICFYDAATLEQISITPVTEEINIIERSSVQWNPSGTKITFNLDAWRLGRDSDIFLVDVESGEITNITSEGDGDAAPGLFDGGPFVIDMCPQWLDDETIVFARHHFDERRDIDPTFYTIGVDGDEPEIWAETDSDEIVYVVSPTRLLDDGRIVFVGDSGSNIIQLYSIAQGETPTLIDIGEPRSIALEDANEHYSILHDYVTYESLIVPHNDPESIIITSEFFELEPDQLTASRPALGPGSDSFVLALNNNNRSVVVHEGGAIKEIAYLRGEDVSIDWLIWVPGTVLVCGKGTSWLIKHEPND